MYVVTHYLASGIGLVALASTIMYVLLCALEHALSDVCVDRSTMSVILGITSGLRQDYSVTLSMEDQLTLLQSSQIEKVCRDLMT